MKRDAGGGEGWRKDPDRRQNSRSAPLPSPCRGHQGRRHLTLSVVLNLVDKIILTLVRGPERPAQPPARRPTTLLREADRCTTRKGLRWQRRDTRRAQLSSERGKPRCAALTPAPRPHVRLAAFRGNPRAPNHHLEKASHHDARRYCADFLLDAENGGLPGRDELQARDPEAILSAPPPLPSTTDVTAKGTPSRKIEVDLEALREGDTSDPTGRGGADGRSAGSGVFGAGPPAAASRPRGGGGDDGARPGEGGQPPCRRLRVGFLSAFFFHHSVGLLVQGVVTRLDRRRFETTAIFLQPHPTDASGAAPGTDPAGRTVGDDVYTRVRERAEHVLDIPSRRCVE